MSEIDNLRLKVKQAYTRLDREYPKVSTLNPIGEIIDYIDSGYIHGEQLHMIKDRRMNYVLNDSDKVDINQGISSSNRFIPGSTPNLSFWDSSQSNGLFGTPSLFQSSNSVTNLSGGLFGMQPQSQHLLKTNSVVPNSNNLSGEVFQNQTLPSSSGLFGNISSVELPSLSDGENIKPNFTSLINKPISSSQLPSITYTDLDDNLQTFVYNYKLKDSNEDEEDEDQDYEYNYHSDDEENEDYNSPDEN